MTQGPTEKQMVRHLLRANEIALRSRDFGHHPFGCIVVGPDHETTLIEHGNIDVVDHAESSAARIAWRQFDSSFLWNCTLYTTVEPCAMCAGTIYWANIGRVVYGMSESSLREITGDDAENPTLNLPCRAVFATSFKLIQVVGPVGEVAEEFERLHRSFWKPRSQS